MNELKTVAIIDYEVGNLRSVSGAVQRVGYKPIITNQVSDLEKADKLILPGVGAYGDGMKLLRKSGLIEPLTSIVMDQKKPILAICLGMQLLCRNSTEFGFNEGLGWIEATVDKLVPGDSELRIPHVGWNDLLIKRDNLLFEGITPDDLFYYVHSFKVIPEQEDLTIGECNYGETFTSSIHKDNIYATQFHPEKSQLAGLRLLKNFLDNA